MKLQVNYQALEQLRINSVEPLGRALYKDHSSILRTSLKKEDESFMSRCLPDLSFLSGNSAVDSAHPISDLH